MYKIENTEQAAFDAEIDRFHNRLAEHNRYWSNLQQSTPVKELINTLSEQFVANISALLLENALKIDIETTLTDAECLAAIPAVVSGTTLSCSAYTESAHVEGQSRLVSFRFQSRLPPVLPRHIDSVQNAQATQRSRFAPNMLGEDKSGTSYHVATIQKDTP